VHEPQEAGHLHNSPRFRRVIAGDVCLVTYDGRCPPGANNGLPIMNCRHQVTGLQVIGAASRVTVDSFKLRATKFLALLVVSLRRPFAGAVSP
jgi:hypothetical protein